MPSTSTSTITSLATYIARKAHKWTENGRQWCHFNADADKNFYRKRGKCEFEPRDIFTHKKVLTCRIRLQNGRFFSQNRFEKAPLFFPLGASPVAFAASPRTIKLQITKPNLWNPE